jgi:uncharacterized OB-fold protein
MAGSVPERNPGSVPERNPGSVPERNPGAPPPDWATPVVTPVNREWFTSGTLAVQRCTACAALQHPPEEVCHQCGATDFQYRAVAPRGTVYSFVVVHYAANPALAGSVPYAVALVSLDEQPEVRVVGNIPSIDPAEVRIGMPVEAYWDEREDVLLPQWRPA